MNIKQELEITIPVELELQLNLSTLVELLNRGAKYYYLNTWDREGAVEQPVAVEFEPVFGEKMGLLVRHKPVGEPCTCIRDRSSVDCALHKEAK